MSLPCRTNGNIHGLLRGIWYHFFHYSDFTTRRLWEWFLGVQPAKIESSCARVPLRPILAGCSACALRKLFSNANSIAPKRIDFAVRKLWGLILVCVLRELVLPCIIDVASILRIDVLTAKPILELLTECCCLSLCEIAHTTENKF